MTEAGLATGFADSSQSTGLLLWQVTNRWQAAQRAALKPFDLTHVQFVLLATLTWLSRADTPVTQARLAAEAATDPMMTSQVLRALAARGLVERMPHPDDRRAKAIVATAAGIRLVNRAIGPVEACDRDFFVALGPTANLFHDALSTLARAEPDN